MPAFFRTSRRVEFRDTDAAGIMHFASIMALMEEAEHEFLRHLELPLFRPAGEGAKISWPRVATSCDFKSPVRFEDTIEILVAVERLGSKSVTYRFTMQSEGRDVAEGTMTSACCRVGNGSIAAVEVPADVVQKLTPYLAAPEKPTESS